jgi:hypothetical protein
VIAMAQRLAELEARLAMAEARIAELERRTHPAWPLGPTPVEFKYGDSPEPPAIAGPR